MEYNPRHVARAAVQPLHNSSQHVTSHVGGRPAHGQRPVHRVLTMRGRTAQHAELVHQVHAIRYTVSNQYYTHHTKPWHGVTK